MYEVELENEVIYEGHVFDLHVKRVRLPDNNEAPREVIVHPGAVAVLPILPDGQIVLVRQFRSAARQVMLEIPAGTLEPNEPLLEAAAREMREETGFRPGKLEPLGGIYVTPGYSTEYIHFFLGQELTADPLDNDEDEFIEIVQISFREAIDRVLNGQIEDSKTVSCLLKAARRFPDLVV